MPAEDEARDGVRNLAMLLLIGVSGLLDEDELVFVRFREMAVDVFEECDGVAVGEAVVGIDEERTRVRDGRNQLPVADFAFLPHDAPEPL